MTFAPIEECRRIERVEAELTRVVVEAVIAAERARDAFVHALEPGVASYLRPGSPMNKVIGAGLEAPLDPGVLGRLEDLMRARAEPTRVELATLAIPVTGTQLSARGYRSAGLESVLVRPIGTESATRISGIHVEPVAAEALPRWKRTIIEAVAAPDRTGEPVDELSYDAIVAAIEDWLEAPGVDYYLAFVDGTVAGAASLRVHEGIAMLSGSATLPASRRRGVHAALVAARLAEAQERGAELAVITTAPGSQSEANALKHGFACIYSRTIWVSP
jgi:GNAT superfamily N-acetyltransferase